MGVEIVKVLNEGKQRSVKPALFFAPFVKESDDIKLVGGDKVDRLCGMATSNTLFDGANNDTLLEGIDLLIGRSANDSESHRRIA